ncbi:hypothetical protein V2J09_021926 [Rumex salicifolius]
MTKEETEAYQLSHWWKNADRKNHRKQASSTNGKHENGGDRNANSSAGDRDRSSRCCNLLRRQLLRDQREIVQ